MLILRGYELLIYIDLIFHYAGPTAQYISFDLFNALLKRYVLTQTIR